MEKDFDELIEGYLENNIGISGHFLSSELAGQLRENLLAACRHKQLSAAATGHARTLSHNAQTRGDSIYWLDRKHSNACENRFLDLVEDFIRYLNQTCYAGLTGYEFHYSLYEAGSFYKKHLDQFSNSDQRQYSMITYLNPQWQESDGGQLLVQHERGGQAIAPTHGKTVFFKSSELVHEVLLTHATRMSVTGWLKRN